jgi:flavin reductase (DIM6/NTAB) family NADH-FMN oxidoreductase RutF
MHGMGGAVEHRERDGGDHLIFVGRVLRFMHDPEGKPLLYFRGNYGKVHS